MLEQKPQNMCSHRLESQSASEITVSAASLYDNQKTCISGQKQSHACRLEADIFSGIQIATNHVIGTGEEKI